jgi:outer membrane immunogenic protein
MKRFIFAASAGLLAAAMAMPSFAADLSRPAYKAPDYYVASFNWTGLYVGLNGGYAFGNSSWDAAGGGAISGNFDVDGAMAGGTFGYNLQTGVWVWGLEGDLDYSWLKGSTAVAACTGCETRNNWFATVRGRIGYGADRWLPYITGGAAFGDIKMTPPAPDTDTSKVKVGWTAGLGIEYAFVGSWSTKLEYLYADLGKASCGSATCIAAGGVDVKLHTNIVRAGLNYRF